MQPIPLVMEIQKSEVVQFAEQIENVCCMVIDRGIDDIDHAHDR